MLYSLVCEGFTYDGVVLLSRNSVLLDTKLTFLPKLLLLVNNDLLTFDK